MMACQMRCGQAICCRQGEIPISSPIRNGALDAGEKLATRVCLGPTGLFQRVAIITGWSWIALLAIRLLSKCAHLRRHTGFRANPKDESKPNRVPTQCHPD